MPGCDVNFRCNGRTMYLLILVFVAVHIAAGKINPCDEIEIVPRKEWQARPAVRDRAMTLPVNHIIIYHTVTSFCKNKMACMRQVQFIQNFHLDDRGWWDIAYNFLIGGDGRFYEARGWNHTGSHAVNFNTDALALAFIGNYEKIKPTRQMLNNTLKFIDCGVRMGYLTPSREIHGHRDVSCTESPGKYVYEVIRYWPNYKGGRMPLYNCNPLSKPVVHKDIVDN